MNGLQTRAPARRDMARAMAGRPAAIQAGTACQPVIQGRSLPGFRTAQMWVIRSSAIRNANTVTVTPYCWATRPGWPLTVRSRNVTLSGARCTRSARYRAISSAPSTGWSVALTRPPPSAVTLAPGSRRPTSVPTSPASSARLNSLTTPACRAVGVGGACDARMRRRPEEGSWRHAARTAGDLRHLGEGVAEDIVQNERDALGRGHRFEHDQERHADRLVEGDPVGRVGRDASRPAAGPLRWLGQRLGDPFADVALSAGARRAEQVQADAAGDRRQPGARGVDGVLPGPGHGVPAGVGLLRRVLGLGGRAQQPVGDIDQPRPLAHDRARFRLGPAAPWLSRGAHGGSTDLRPLRRAAWRGCGAARGGAEGGTASLSPGANSAASFRCRSSRAFARTPACSRAPGEFADRSASAR